MRWSKMSPLRVAPPSRWSTYEALLHKATTDTIRDLGPCPNCGAAASVDMVNVTALDGPPSWVVGEAKCSQKCWLQDPDAYIAAVSR